MIVRSLSFPFGKRWAFFVWCDWGLEEVDGGEGSWSVGGAWGRVWGVQVKEEKSQVRVEK